MDNSIYVQWAPFSALNAIEMPIVLALQRIFKTKEDLKWHTFYQDILGTRYLGMYPFFLYALGYKDIAQLFAHKLILYSIVSVVAKLLMPRFRPSHYSGVVGEKFLSSSLPSRHTMASYIFATTFLPKPVCYFFVFTMMLNRVICGCHFLTDTIVAVFFGQLVNYLTEKIDNITEKSYSLKLLLLIALVSVYFWPMATRIAGDSIPLIARYSHEVCMASVIYCLITFVVLRYLRVIIRGRILFPIELGIMLFSYGLIDYLGDSMYGNTSQPLCNYFPRFK